MRGSHVPPREPPTKKPSRVLTADEKADMVLRHERALRVKMAAARAARKWSAK